jgi:glutamate/aspartate transport system permease protein
MEDFDIHVVFHSIPYLAEGMLLTLKLTLYGIGGGLVLGTVLALARLSPFKPLSFVAGTYVNFFRSMPLIR